MKTLIRSKLFNRYTITLSIFLIWFVFFDNASLRVNIQLKKEIEAMEKTEQYYIEQISIERKELEALKNDKFTVEKYARERFFLSKPNEEVFIIKDSSNKSL